MTQEDKELLLKDICARLPYGVKGLAYIVGEPCNINTNINGVFNGAINKSIVTDYETPMLELIDLSSKDITIKPYLRPMSSMTEEEKEECCSIFNNSMYQFEVDKYGDVESTEPTVEKECLYYDAELMAEWLTWLNAHHFDYRWLIRKGLALEAPEGMYNN